MWSFIKFLQGEENRFHLLRIQFYAGLGAKPKQAKTIAIQRRIDNLGQQYYDCVISAMEQRRAPHAQERSAGRRRPLRPLLS
ncbi:unnamed protein product, partial [Rotaria magnacalcarata]